MKITGFKRICNFFLEFGDTCALVGVTATGAIIVEAYTEDDVKTYRLDASCHLIAADDGELPADLITPTIPTDHPLNHRGGRQRGLRDTDRVAAWVRPLTIMEKMPLMPKLGLSIPPMLLLGIAESHVLSEATLSDTVSFVCRRLRFAYALAQPQVDDDGLPYDYDTHETYVAHLYDAASPMPIHETFNAIDGVTLQRPMDCVVQDKRLIIADSAADSTNEAQANRVLVFEVVEANEA